MPSIIVKIESINKKPEIHLTLHSEGRDYIHFSTFLNGTSADDFFNAMRKAENEYYSHDPRNPNRFPGNSSQLDLEFP